MDNLEEWKTYYQRKEHLDKFWPIKPAVYTHSIEYQHRVDVYFHDWAEDPNIFHLPEQKFRKRYNTDN